MCKFKTLLIGCLWAAGGNWRTQRNPTMHRIGTHGENFKHMRRPKAVIKPSIVEKTTVLATKPPSQPPGFLLKTLC